MKTILLILVLIIPLLFFGQITTPVIKARFGVDADLRANYFNGAVQTGNDDWFNLVATDTSGKAVIDTTGATSIIAGYLSDVSPYPKRMATLIRGMSKPKFSVINSRLWVDAVYVRDYHGTDTTVFTVASKNGESPAIWTPGVQAVPDKNDILDMFMHVRRAGPNATDSLWMFGGIAMDNVTGNRYFDFEMYQTDIYYDRVSQKFYGYGPDEGHTSWKFDAAGNILTAGDIIFTGAFQSSTLTSIEARIWVSRTDWMTVAPTTFNWSGQFDGGSPGSNYGYASISPKTAGAFYTGLGSANGVWSGPFGLVLQDNSLQYTNPAPASTTNGKYVADQFIEFSVNLTKLGLDPVTLLGGDICGTPFNRLVVKTRSSSSFTADLKDFVAPTDLFLAARANLETQTPIICATNSVSKIYVKDSVSTSTYTWTTTNGHIVGSTTGPSINVDTAGTYIVKQYLQAGCSLYASDTLAILQFSNCFVLENNLVDFRASLNDQVTSRLNWTVLHNEATKSFIIERSFDGMNFTPVGSMNTEESENQVVTYNYNDAIRGIPFRDIYYRIKVSDIAGRTVYSEVKKVSVTTASKNNVTVIPNPVKDVLNLSISSTIERKAQVNIYDYMGKIVQTVTVLLDKGNNVVSLYSLVNKPKGIYEAVVIMDNELISRKISLTH